MSSAWLLPEHIADVLPSEARRIEELAARTARPGARLRLRAGDAAAAGAPGVAAVRHRRALDLQTFKLVDQLSGRTLGLRADTTPQVARIDAHLLNRARRDAPVLLRPGAAHAAGRVRTPRASRCSSAPRSTAMPAWRPTSRCRSWRSTACARAGVERARCSTWPTRASCAACWPGVPVDAQRAARRGRRAGRQGRARACDDADARLSRRAAREALRGLLRLYGDESSAASAAREVLPRRARRSRARSTTWHGWHAMCGTRIRRCGSASTWPT